MMENTRFRVTLIVLCNAVILAIASPVYMPKFIQEGAAGRNIRHLPCVSRRTGETGVCMFAFTCAKANGTHLGTCIERFYFGSCCKIDDNEPDIFQNENSIDDGPVKKPYPNNKPSIESNSIPEYSVKPIDIVTKRPQDVTESPQSVTNLSTVGVKKPVKFNNASTVSISMSTDGFKPLKVTESFINQSTKPIVESTTQLVGLSTFQSVQNNPSFQSSTTNPLTQSVTKLPQRITTKTTSTTEKNIVTQSNKPQISTLTHNQKPLAGSNNVTKVVTKPVVRPSSPKPSTTTNPSSFVIDKTRTTTAKPVLTTTERSTVIGTRFPPRNSTTTTTTTTVKPGRPKPSKRPTTISTTTTKKPVSYTPVKRITTTTTTTEATPTATVTKRPSVSTGTVTRPTIVKNVTSGTIRPSSSSPKPENPPGVSRPGNKPVSTSGQERPLAKPTSTTMTTVAVDKTTTKRPSTTASLDLLNEGTIPSFKPMPTRPKPVVGSQGTKVTPTRKPNPTTTTTTGRPNPSPPRPSSVFTNTTTTTTTTTSLPVISNEVFNPEDTINAAQGIDNGKVEATSHSPGLVTWMSNSDDATKSPVPATSTSEPEEPTNTEWTPITTPSGWILIQSQAPIENDNDQDLPIVEPTVGDKPTIESPVSEKLTTVQYPGTTAEWSMENPSLPTTVQTTLPTTTTTTTTTTTMPIIDDYVPTAGLNMSNYKEVCGRRLFPESRIVGGARSTFGKWPWQISLRQWRTSTYLHKCGAALLNENWAITAAHCVENVPPSDLLLRLGEHDLASEDEPYGFQERRVQIVASHPQFDPRTFEYDLALLRFYEPLLPFQPNTLPICLPDDDANYVGSTAHVTGWGRLYEDGPLPSVLQEVPVPVINNTVCEAMYRTAGYIEHIPKIFICAGWRKGGFDSCEGDSGGPLVIQRPRDKRWILAGVISWGIGCAEPNQPGVYTRISEFREWINQILQF